jgi:hypothetical protein
MLKLAFLPNNDLQKGFTVSKTAEKPGWPESLLWVINIAGKNDAAKYRELQWGIKDRLKAFRLKSEGKSKNTNSLQAKFFSLPF